MTINNIIKLKTLNYLLGKIVTNNLINLQSHKNLKRIMYKKWKWIILITKTILYLHILKQRK
jgi:hypothetical protein